MVLMPLNFVEKIVSTLSISSNTVRILAAMEHMNCRQIVNF